jgi:O-6-methylguanine DNA methyltransferase
MTLQLKLLGVQENGAPDNAHENHGDKVRGVGVPATGATPGPAGHAAYTTLPSPIGPVLVGFSGRRVTMLAPAGDAAEFERRLRQRAGRPAARTDEAPGWLRAAVATTSGTGLDYGLDGLSRFERAVLARTAAIPAGEVRPYAWVAAGIGLPGAVRAVGRALHVNPVPLLIPCHRVVRSDGSLGGYALGPDAKRALLAAEGVDVGWLERLAAGRVRFLASPASRRWCYPTCTNLQATPRADQVPFQTAAAATAAGYQPCDRCQPAPTQAERKE